MSGGRWTARKADLHVCPRPHRKVRGEDVREGDVWTCDTCGRDHVVKGLEHGMQWDPIDPPQITWSTENPPIDLATLTE